MNEFFRILFSFNFKKIFYEPTNNAMLQLFRYAFVGGWATVADWGVQFLLTDFAKLHYLVSAVAAFITGLIVNFILSKKFVFSCEKKQYSSSTEFAVYAIIGIIGLIMTAIIMYVLTDKLKLYHMISKVIATAVVFVWNFVARKVVLYR